ncbi:T9SS type A sorting domain-containing protein [Arundinibacter roseus]|uniref:T9SS type A sorting domain-containing protein n=1 Tax=Arundinibacter roseus TaxID=2070510 RepID=A0A4R4K8X2_9BACT|nr:T9SS type A sorting domain-containing protein [Arundinibacter roseus]TDB64070.1 T9SS type A sorting domain-containing protein [Arundinibacter roseus]
MKKLLLTCLSTCILLLLQAQESSAQTIDVSSSCFTGTATLSVVGTNDGKTAYGGTGSIGGTPVTINILWNTGANSWFLLLGGGTPAFQYVGDTPAPPNNNSLSWTQLAVGGCPVTTAVVINGTGTQNDPLPVKLVSFTGGAGPESVLLRWETAEEVSNAGFEIQQSANAKSWERIGFVKGNETTTERKAYSFEDVQPLNGINYYRLKQLDLDGKFALSKAIAIRFDGKNAFLIYPNPTENSLQIRLPDMTSASFIRIKDMTGRTIKTFETGQRNLDIANLPAGTYLLEAGTTEGGRFAERFLKK